MAGASTRKSLDHCGVPQCNSYKSSSISMHRIPKKVLETPSELKKWVIALKMGKKFPKKFFICKWESIPTSPEFTEVAVQCMPEKSEKATQVELKGFVNIASLWNTDKKLNTMTGIPSMEIFNVMVELCCTVRKEDKCTMLMKDRILLTMHKLKSNCSFAEIAIGFELSNKTAKIYFADTIALLAKVMKNLIHWQSEERNVKSLPKYFEDFPNVRTILDCTEVRTVTFRCLTCRTCTYSHYKGGHTLKILIGVSPSGCINFVSKVSTGRSSGKAIFNQTAELMSKLQPGDAVMVDKGFMIGDELANAGVEMVRPAFLFGSFSKEDVERNTKIAAARVHVERRIARLKIFKVLSEKIGVAMIPYVDDCMIVICGLSNISQPILKDNKFF